MPKQDTLRTLNEPPLSLSRDYNPLVRTVRELASPTAGQQHRYSKPQYFQTNDPGEDLDIYSVMEYKIVGGENPTLQISKPDTETEFFCVADKQRLLNGATGVARLIGLDFPALVNVDSSNPPAFGDLCGIAASGETYLTKNAFGFKCVSDVNESKAWVVRDFEPKYAFFILLADLTGDSVLCDMLANNYSTVLESNVTVYHAGNITNGAETDAHCQAIWKGGRWEMTVAGCV